MVNVLKETLKHSSVQALIFLLGVGVVFLTYLFLRVYRPARARTIREAFRKYTGGVICLLGAVVLISGLWGFVSRKNGEESLPEALYETAQLFFLNVGSSELSESGLIGFAMTVAVVLAALVAAKAIILLFHDSYVSLRLALSWNHTVICGLGQIGRQLVADLLKPGSSARVVVIEKDPANPHLDEARSLGATVIIGDSSRSETLSDAKVARAKEVFVLSGDDGLNVEITAEIGELLNEVSRSRPLNIYAHIVDINVASTLRPFASLLHASKDKQEASGTGQETRKVRVEIFSIPRASAARLVTTQLWPYAPQRSPARAAAAASEDAGVPIRADGVRGSSEAHDLKNVEIAPPEVAHFAILGFGAMGQALALQLAQLGSFPNGRRNRFTIADCNIQSSARTFLSRFGRFTPWTSSQLGVTEFDPAFDAWDNNSHELPPHLQIPHPDPTQGPRHPEAIQYVCNAEFQELPSTLCDEKFAIHLAERFRAPNVKPVVFICGEHDRQNFDAAVQLLEDLRHQGVSDVPIFVWLPRQPALARALRNDHRLRPFGECERSASYREITSPARETIGEQIHDGYRDQYGGKPWIDEEDWKRESSRIAADHVDIKLATLGYKVHRKTDAGIDPQDASNPPGGTPSERSGFAKEWGEMLTLFEQIEQGRSELGESIKRANKDEQKIQALRESFQQDRRRRIEALDESKKNLLKTMELLGEMEHYRFVAERLLSGWCYPPPNSGQSQRSKKDRRDLKLNETLVPWSVLKTGAEGDDEALKDFHQVKVVLEKCEKLGFQLVPLSPEERPRPSTPPAAGRYVPTGC